jgi:hypothetical protein
MRRFDFVCCFIILPLCRYFYWKVHFSDEIWSPLRTETVVLL